MNKILSAGCVFWLSILCFWITGCGRESEVSSKTFYFTTDYVSDLRVEFSSADQIYYRVFAEDFRNRIRDRTYSEPLYKDIDSAFCKRKAVFELSFFPYSYKLLNYNQDGSLSWNFLVAMRLDAVSNLEYNLFSLCRIPNRLIISSRVSTSFFDWLENILIMIWDLILSLIMLFAGPIIGFICHPLESLANLTIGIFYIPLEGFETYWPYVKNTNLIMSVWDILYGLFYILLRTIIFWC